MSYIIYPIGDSAITIELGEVISEALNRKVIGMQAWLKANPVEGVREITIAYSSLSVQYDLLTIRELAGKSSPPSEFISNLLEKAYHLSEVSDETRPVIKIPVCYDAGFGIDLEEISSRNKLTVQEIIRLHTANVYRVYMVGFLPGFAYMGEVDEKIAIARKPAPRNKVAAGSVGIAGRQTGIYPLACPGGWQIIGRTPVSLFNPAEAEVAYLHAGDLVQFSEISLEEFHQLNS